MNPGQELLARTQARVLHRFWFKLVVLLAAFVLLAALATWSLLTFDRSPSEKELQAAAQTDVQEKGYLLAKLIRSFRIPAYYEKGDFENLQKTIASLRNEPETILYIFVKNAEGNIVAQTPENIAASETPTGRLSSLNPIPSGQAVAHKIFAATLNTGKLYQVLDTAIAVLPNQPAELHIGLRTSFNPDQPANRNSWLIFAAIAALVGIGAFTFQRVVAVQILQPVNQFVQCVKQIGQGNMEYSLAFAVNDEMTGLRDSLKEMMEQLKGMVQTEADINRMQGQIMNMLSTVSAAADGNLTVEAEVTADALGSLADAFNMMVASLASLVDQVRTSATDMSAATNEILVSSAQMIKGAEEQQNHINNITSAVDEIAVSMQQVANNAEAAARASQMATEAAQKGEKSVEETILGMHRIRNTVQVTSKKIKSLGDRSIEIGEITTTIEDIARQTTILALNAAIEAARAGEHGRGFGVVAEEVRKLAERSSTATKNIGDLIKGIQAETNEAVRTMEEGTREVEEGTRLADVAGSSLKEIDKSVGQVADLIQEISLAAKQQARGTDGVVRSMETISDITNLHAEGVRKTTETIEKLATLSDRLTEAIGNFKIRESGAKPEVPGRKAIAPQPQRQPQRPPQRQVQPPPQPPQPQSQMASFVPPPGGVSELNRQPGGDEEEELITEDDFFKTS